MNQLTNKSAHLPAEPRPRHTTSSARGQFAAYEAGANLRQKDIKSIPFSGLLTNKLLARLPGEDFARLLPHLEPVSLEGGHYIYGLGDTIEFAYFPETAVVSQIHLLADGNMTEVALVGNEGLIGLSAIFNAPEMNYWSQVVVAGSALRIRIEEIKDEFNHAPAVQRLVLNYASSRIAQISQRAVCNGRHTLSERLATWLLLIHDRAGNGPLLLTHEEIARHLGARRASISVSATLLRDRKVISYNRGHIRILDRDALLTSACECYQMHARYSE